MKDVPMLFSDPMALAIWEGLKTETRRVMKPQPVNVWGYGIHQQDGVFRAHIRKLGEPDAFVKCPYGQEGDTVWVRETWAKVPRTAYWHDQSIPHREFIDEEGFAWWYVYRANWDRVAPPWKPSIYLPRHGCRMESKRTFTKVQRLQEITEAEALREGIRNVTKDGSLFKYCVYDQGDTSSTPWSEMARSAVEAYAALWDKINASPKPVKGKDGAISHYVSYPWEDVQETRQFRGKLWQVIGNPWVWVVGFEKVKP